MTTRADNRVHVTVVCTGNICRSPMAEKVLAQHFHVAGLDVSVADPYYPSDDSFTEVREQIESAMQGLVRWIENRVR
ncbi:MAG: hypothetical protein WBQ44_03495 [Rhodococcus sp. (in: high G+C Gram-positive bacteria)]